MKLTFLGAAHEVTGSCTYLEVGEQKFLVDCGMEQGPDFFENQPVPIAPGELDFVLLTHAHIDHSGKLPLLCKNGFKGKIYATRATCELATIMLRDSAHIQMFEAEWRNRKAKRSGEDQYVPIYDMEDAEAAIACLSAIPYESESEIAPGVIAKLVDVGHLLGSASILLTLTEGDQHKTVAFSGDIGNHSQPLLKDPVYLSAADYVVMESTYGDRDHTDARPDYVAELSAIIQRTFDRGGNVVIPSFAVGRTQEMLYFLREIKERELVKGHGVFPVYVDSPLAIEATEVFSHNISECLDEETKALVQRGVNPISFPGLHTTITSDQSREINFDPSPKVIISASGMCDAGRIKHHLKHNLWRQECTVLFVGYQAVGSPGRIIHDGAKSVKLFGEEIEIKAEVLTLRGISGHADRSGLLRWIGAISGVSRVFVIHGEQQSADHFVETLRGELSLTADAPYSGSEFDLIRGEWLYLARPVPVEKKQKGALSEAFSRLVAAGERLVSVIRSNQGSTNKDLAKFTDQIIALCEKWGK